MRLASCGAAIAASATQVNTPLAFSLGFVESGVWTRRRIVGGEGHVNVHTADLGSPCAVVLTAEPVLEAKLAGTRPSEDPVVRKRVVISTHKDPTPMATKTVSKWPKAGLLSGALILFLTQGVAHAEDGSSAAAQANNPLANMTAFNLQNYYIGRLTETDDDANQFWLRYAQPFKLFDGEWLMRASLPLNSFPTLPDGGTETGLGDLNVFAAYLIDTGDPALSFGFGPQVSARHSDARQLKKIDSRTGHGYENAGNPGQYNRQRMPVARVWLVVERGRYQVC